MSYWTHRRPVRRRRSVDIDETACASVSLLDEGGPRALTLRAVARRLGVAPASLYSRFETADDLFDLALDTALAEDGEMIRALGDADVVPLMLTWYRHLLRHRWACQVIALRPPRGPAYLRLSDRLCELLVEAGVTDPLGVAYTLSNLVVGSAATAGLGDEEAAAPVDPAVAPTYARLHRERGHADPEASLLAGLEALRTRI
ncbi:TetR/AcrR family transcriptional regulator [Brachybacterium hainanense]|uniref:TetR/AcrR family transcriptional regulator n=1 Tax=Brachybacterium hainanense TaxID=1541174 RepID=A0ABV6RA25_9MICO